MSSRIVGPKDAIQAEPLRWDPVSGQTGEISAGIAMHRSAGSAAPTWDEYRQLEARLRETSAQLPVREQQARQAGFREGEGAAAARWEAALEKLARTVHDLVTLRPRLRKDAEQDVLKLSLAVARRILRRELSVDPEAVLALIRSALERVDLRETHRVRVRPEDTALVRDYLVRLGIPSQVEVVADPGLERGGVVIDTGRGALDASLETQLDEIERGFADILDRRRA